MPWRSWSIGSDSPGLSGGGDNLAIRQPEGPHAACQRSPGNSAPDWHQRRHGAAIGDDRCGDAARPDAAAPPAPQSLSIGPLEVPDHPALLHRAGGRDPVCGPTCGLKNPATLRPTCEAYIRALDRLSQHLHRLAAIAFDLRPKLTDRAVLREVARRQQDHFEDKIDRGFSILRVLNYPDQREEPEEGPAAQTPRLAPQRGEHSGHYDNLTMPASASVSSWFPATGWHRRWSRAFNVNRRRSSPCRSRRNSPSDSGRSKREAGATSRSARSSSRRRSVWRRRQT